MPTCAFSSPNDLVPIICELDIPHFTDNRPSYLPTANSRHLAACGASILWKTLSAIAAIVAVSMPIIDVPRKTELMTDAYGGWLQLMNEYEDLWRSRESSNDGTFAAKLTSLKTREVDVAKKTAKLPSDDDALAERCYAEVLKARGLLG